MRVGPCASDQLPVPAEQGGRCHAEGRPPSAGKQPRQCGQPGPFGGSVPRSFDLAAQDHDLVTQHEDLDVLADIAAGHHRQQLQHATQHHVQKGQGHADHACARAVIKLRPRIGSSQPRPHLRAPQVRVTGWNVRIQLRIPLDDPPGEYFDRIPPGPVSTVCVPLVVTDGDSYRMKQARQRSGGGRIKPN
jgi:hypothetical protein